MLNKLSLLHQANVPHPTEVSGNVYTEEQWTALNDIVQTIHE